MSGYNSCVLYYNAEKLYNNQVTYVTKAQNDEIYQPLELLLVVISLGKEFKHRHSRSSAADQLYPSPTEPFTKNEPPLENARTLRSCEAPLALQERQEHVSCTQILDRRGTEDLPSPPRKRTMTRTRGPPGALPLRDQRWISRKACVLNRDSPRRAPFEDPLLIEVGEV